MAKQKDKERKTNALREVEAAGLAHRFVMFECEEALSGVEVAARLGEDPDRVFKTLVTEAKSGAHYVFMIPVACELDLKKAASAVDEKAIAMIKARDLLPLTGYVHGGCSPIGMKKPFQTFLHETAANYEHIFVSAGKLGFQIELSPTDLMEVIKGETADIVLDPRDCPGGPKSSLHYAV